jgi:hypothetical protein
MILPGKTPGSFSVSLPIEPASLRHEGMIVAKKAD